MSKKVDKEQAKAIILDDELKRLRALSKETLIQNLLFQEERHVDRMSEKTLSERLKAISNGRIELEQK